MKIGIYILSKYAKQTYTKECYDVRLNAGMAVVCDILKKKGFTDIDYCSAYNVTKFDMIMFSVTADCDWWNFIDERTEWPKGNYKVCVGGQGVLNVRPFLEYVDYFMLGRAEGVIEELAEAIQNGNEYESEYCINSKTFSVDKKYSLKQVNKIYPHDVKLDNGQTYHEDVVGCNHRCLFCGYTWHRKQAAQEEFNYSGLWNGGKDRERALIDMNNGVDVDLVKLRTTAIDGLSERLRFMVNKKITNQMLLNFLERLARCKKPHQVKFYNIVGFPTETETDWFEFLEAIKQVDTEFKKQEKQTSILLHSTPFRAMPATPLACKPMSYKNYRGKVAKVLGQGKYKGNIFYQGNAMWAVESMGTESLPTVIQSAIVWRGTEADTDNFVKVAKSKKFRSASAAVKQATLEKYFDVDTLFREFTPETLPTRYLRTYCEVEKMW
jgi:hypothetical protein